MNDLLIIINACLHEYIQTIDDGKLRQTIEYALFPGGKRLRPLLLLTCLQDLGLDPRQGIYVASAIEMIHTYSLIHDDLPAMDNDDFRRGKPSLHKQFSESMAILAGDALLTDAFFWMTKTITNDFIKIELVKLASLQAGSNGMIRGQTIDIRSDPFPDLKDINFMNSRKTGDLFAFVFQCAGLIAKVSPQMLNKLGLIAHHFGLAFQIKDDIEDYGLKKAQEAKNYINVFGKEATNELFLKYRNLSLSLIEENFGEKSLYEFIKRIL
ncbi:MAG: polyprenyl synthetase family protein [Bacilli bacterium]